MEELLTISVKEMARRIREGLVSPVEVLEAHIRRIEEVNPKINAVVSKRYEEAHKEAKQAEERLARDKENLPPLFGVPCTIKDTAAVAGLPWTGGVWARRNLIPDWDAIVVQRLKQAGAIVMGKTNTPEAAMWCETYNHVYGRTKNPYDTRRGVGGSSGGEGAIVAAGGSPFGIGSDIGGSIRYPSAFNGVAGHKPSGRMVPSQDNWPAGPGPLGPYLTFGPLCRRVEDLELILPLIAGPHEKDRVAIKQEWKSPSAVDVSSIKVYYYENNGVARTGTDVRRAISMAVAALIGRGLAVEHWRPEGIEWGLPIWLAALSQNEEPFIKNLEGDEPISPLKEIARFITRRSKITFPALFFALVEKPAKLLRAQNQRLLELVPQLRQRIEDKLGENGVLICPVFSTAAPKHSLIYKDLPGIGFTCIWNILEFPSTVIPIYHRKDGLPVSIQIVSSRWHDHLTLALAKELERIFGGWRPPEKVE